MFLPQAEKVRPNLGQSLALLGRNGFVVWVPVYCSYGQKKNMQTPRARICVRRQCVEIDKQQFYRNRSKRTCPNGLVFNLERRVNGHSEIFNQICQTLSFLASRVSKLSQNSSRSKIWLCKTIRQICMSFQIRKLTANWHSQTFS